MAVSGPFASLKAHSGRVGLLPVVAMAIGGIAVLKIAQISLGGVPESMAIGAAAAQEKSALAPAPAVDGTPGADKPAEPESTTDADSKGGNAPKEMAGGGHAAGAQRAGRNAAQPEDDSNSLKKGEDVAERPTVAASGGDGEAPRFITRSEVEVLNLLTRRRKELERRSSDLEMREKLLKVAEKRVEEKLAELKAIETRIESTFNRKDDEKNQQFKSLVSMYENMKPKDAARIFDTLDMDVLLSVVEQMRARKMAPILANMNAEVAQRLTIELTARATGEMSAGTQSLPAITDRDPG